MGHFAAFAVNMTEAALFLNTIYFTSNSDETATAIFVFSMFVQPSKIFFVYTFIQTVLSERLLDFSWIKNAGILLQTGV